MEHHLALLVIAFIALAFEVRAQITFSAPVSGSDYITNGVSTTSPVSFMSGMAVSGTIMFPAPMVSGSLMTVTGPGAVQLIPNDSVDSVGRITAMGFVGDGSGLTGVSATFPQNISATNETISNTLSVVNESWVSSTLPACDTAHAGTFRRATNKGCWCDGGGSWKNIAPPSAFLSLLGINILVADTCP